MEIITYRDEYKQQVIDLILAIQNEEAGINLSLEEQPDLLNIASAYQSGGGEFWLAVEGDRVIGTLAIMNYGKGNAVLKKFFVRADCRKKGIGRALYGVLLQYAKEKSFHTILLDTPSVARASHKFYERAGFKRISRESLPFPYEYPDRDSYLYMLELG